LAAETTRSARFSEMQAVLKSADNEFAKNLLIHARTLLLVRLVVSSDKKAEFNFLLSTFKEILEEGSSNATEVAKATSDLAAVLDANVEEIGRKFSAMTDVLDKMRPVELYRFVANLRRESIHYRSEGYLGKIVLKSRIIEAQ
jgi:hypothetical protein